MYLYILTLLCCVCWVRLLSGAWLCSLFLISNIRNTIICTSNNGNSRFWQVWCSNERVIPISTCMCTCIGKWVGMCAAISACVMWYTSVVKVMSNIVFPQTRAYLWQCFVSTADSKPDAISACAKMRMQRKPRNSDARVFVPPRLSSLYTMIVFLSMGWAGDGGTSVGERGVGRP